MAGRWRRQREMCSQGAEAEACPPRGIKWAVLAPNASPPGAKRVRAPLGRQPHD